MNDRKRRALAAALDENLGALQVGVDAEPRPQQLAAKAMDGGAFEFIGKPFDVIDLREKVARAVDHVASKTPTP